MLTGMHLPNKIKTHLKQNVFYLHGTLSYFGYDFLKHPM